MLNFNPNSIDGLRAIIKEYGKVKHPFFGENEYGEAVELCVYPDHITAITYQENDCIRTNTYYHSGETEEVFTH